MQQTVNANGKLIDLSEPIIMGVVNVNSDSFYEGSRVASIDKMLQRVEALINGGAEIIDVGAMSSRPGATIIDKDTEIACLHPCIEVLRTSFNNINLSIDTVHSKTAQAMSALGVDMINDISGGVFDDKMYEVVAKTGLPYIMMHMQGTPETMQQKPTYNNITQDILAYFVERIAKAKAAGITDIIVDPGFGFGKTIEHSFTMMRELSAFKVLGLPLLVGLSRKSFIYKTLGVGAELALNGTTAMHMVALEKGANILRVHDAVEARQCITLFTKTKCKP